MAELFSSPWLFGKHSWLEACLLWIDQALWRRMVESQALVEDPFPFQEGMNLPSRVWIYPPRVWIHVPSHAIKQPMQPRWVPPSRWAQVPWVARAVTMMEQPKPTPTQGQPGSLLMVRALSLHRLSSSVNTALPFSSQGLANCCKGQTRNSSCSTGHRRSVTLTPSFSLLFILFVLRAPPSPLTTF